MLYPEEEALVCPASAFSFSKLGGLNAYLSPEMKSTGKSHWFR